MEPSPEKSQRRQNKAVMGAVGALVFIVYGYACLFALNLFLFKFGSRLPFPALVKELCTSLNYFDYTLHPQYRADWKGFVLEPGKPWTYPFRGDTFQTFNVPEKTVEYSLPVDALGFINERPIGDADAIMIGDSFVRSAGCRFEETLPNAFERASGIKTYGAGQAGYGWSHYLEVFRWFAVNAPESSRFRGKDAFIMFYAGNDFADMEVYLERLEDELNPKRGHYFKLRTLVELGRFAYGGFRGMVNRMLGRPQESSYFDNVDTDFRPYANQKSADAEDTITQDMTKGFYPHKLKLEPYKDTRFAFNVYIRKYKSLDWLMTPERQAEARRVFKEFKDLQDQTGIRVHFVLIPNNVQALEPYVTVNDPPKYLFDEVFHTAARNLDKLTQFADGEIRALGMDVVSVQPALMEQVKRDKLWWPGDTHLTPKGNEVVAAAVAAHLKSSSRPTP